MGRRKPFKFACLFLIGITSCWILYITLANMKPGAFKLEQRFHQENYFETTTKKTEVCNEFTQSSKLIQPLTVTSLADWTFKTTVKCPPFKMESNTTSRLKVELECDGNVGRLVTSLTKSSQDISAFEFGNKCLEYVINKCCTGNKLVPNVMHYVWFYPTDMNFFNFISLLSTIRYIKPCLILFHGPSVPTGKYWDHAVSLFPNIILVKREPPTTVFGNKLTNKQHSSDIMRMEALMYYGGIFMDFDQVALRPVEPLRHYQHTQALEYDFLLGCQFIMAKRNSTFLQHWYDGYRTQYKTEWVWNSQEYPRKLSNKYPNLIHVDGYNFTRPNWDNRHQIHKENYDWSTNYGMHMMARVFPNKIDLETIRRLNTTVGSVSRHILFGDKELCET